MPHVSNYNLCEVLQLSTNLITCKASVQITVLASSSLVPCLETQVHNVKYKKLKQSRYTPGVGLTVGTGIPLLFHDRGTRMEWVVSSTLRPHFTPGKDPVPVLKEAWWAPGPGCTGGKNRPHWASIPDRPTRSQSLDLLSYRAHWRIRSQNFRSKILEVLMKRRNERKMIKKDYIPRCYMQTPMNLLDHKIS
jgi:hypothetical protein